MKNNSYSDFFKQAGKAKQKNNAGRKFQYKPSNSLHAAGGNSQKKSRKKIPWTPFLFFVFLMFGFGWGLQNLSYVETVFTKIDISLGGSAQANTEEKSAAKKENSTTTASDEKAKTVVGAGTQKSWSKEELALFSKLQERKDQLDQRESELNKLAEELQKQKGEIEGKIAELEKLRQKISQTLESRVAVDAEKVNRLVAVYSDMKPQSAARVFETMDDELGIEIIAKMNKKNAAAILNMLPPLRAQKLSEKYAGYKVKD